MATTKTAISIDKELYNKVQKLSNKLSISKSQIFSQAVEYVIESNNNLELIKKINSSYEGVLSDEEKDYLIKAKKAYKKKANLKW